jgi:hypothetical protein
MYMLVIQKKYRSFRQAQRRRLFLSALAVLSGVVSAQAAFASNITVANPVSGTTTTSPLWVRAHNVGCNGLTPTAFGFSIDSGATTMGVTPYDIDRTNMSIANGTHTIHFKAWTTAGICPVVNSTVNIGGTGSTGTSSSGSSSGGGTSTPPSNPSVSIPSNAVPSADLDTSNNWLGEHDAGTPGSSRGSTLFPATTPLYDDAREFYMTYSGRGGERWHNSFGNDASATHFVMDTYVYVTNPSQLANLELDLNQVMSDGRTVIFGTQCSTYSHSWEWTYYGSGGPHWHSSNISCDPRGWSANTWHHIQVGFHRDGNGYATHDWVNFDGNHSTFSGASGSAAKALGWAKGSLLMNVQLDGWNTGSGSVTAYFHKTTFYRW